MRSLKPRWWTTRTAAEKRHFLARAGLIALAFVVLVAIPTYIALQPTFMDRYEAYETASETLAGSLHSSLSCHQCHIEPGVVPQTVHAARMFSEFYLSLLPVSREPDLLDTPTSAACNECHVNLRTVSPSGDLNIPHRAHVEMLAMECVECHNYLVHEVSPEGTGAPPMEACLTCHDGVQAKSDCSACHTDKDPPDTHLEEEWVFTHPAAEDESCNECHDWTENWCADCHSQRPESHGEDWRAQHQFRVESRRNCEACHTGDFCIRCHGLVPSLNYDSSITLVR